MSQHSEPNPVGAVEPDMPATSPAPNRVVIKDRFRQDLAVGLVVGAAVLGFIVFAILSFNREVGGLGKPGIVIEKLFLPEPETQITIGQVGVEKEEIAGRYILRVKLDATGEVYNVYVDARKYAQYTVGQSFLVIKPEGGGQDVFDEANKQLKAAEGRR